MRVRSLSIHNLRAIERFEISGLSDFILIAGPNGCGKTTVLDAVRLIKSLYVADEWKRWFNEFGINVDRPTNFSTIFRNTSTPARIEATIELDQSERDFLAEHSYNIAYGLVLNEGNDRKVTITGDPPLGKPRVTTDRDDTDGKKAEERSRAILNDLAKSRTFTAAVEIKAAPPELNIRPSALAAAAFSCFNPEVLGEIEFHSSRRFYAREAVNTVRLNVGDRSEERRNRFSMTLRTNTRT